MRLFNCQHNECRRQNGQALLMFVLFMIVLFVFIGLGIDIGFACITKANLSKAVDAACLTGVRNLFQGDSKSIAIAKSAFAANYGTPGRDAGSVVPTVVISTDAGNNRVMNVTATATINTFFIRVFPQWHTLQVGANAQATRAKLVMTLVLDRSNSMNGNGGAAALPDAVKSFIDLFDDNLDNVAVASFASHARLDVAMEHPFKADVRNTVDALVFAGGTFAQGGLTNALVQNKSVVVVPGENVVKVTVFFTDGLANIIQDNLNCPPTTLWNFGGYDTGSTVGFFNPSNGIQATCPISGGTPSCCPGVNRFWSASAGALRPFTRAAVSADAEYRAVQVADDMRAENMIVYSIGLGNTINQDFLHQIANDEFSSTYNSNLPVGEAAFAPTASDLKGVFQTIAAKILLRITQ